ncbi:MAG: hypothetical protein K8J31_01190 [Anaerolineae bacterium]|nr:hypothetical protein [Anaerolineae bacterium]
MKAIRLLSGIVILLTVLVALLGGLGSGLARVGVHVNAQSLDRIHIHGPLMIGGFLGTLICLERAVALASRYRWSMLVPVMNTAGTIMLLFMSDAMLSRSLLTLGSLGLVLLFGLMLWLHPSRDVAIMASGALCWLFGNVLWLNGHPIYQAVHLWTAFLVLTIVGERLELSRVRRLTRRSEQSLMLAAAVYLVGVLITVFNLDWGVPLLGIGAILMSAWLLRYDIARRTIHQSGLPRYIAACLLLGYGWLGFGGAAAVWKGAIFAGPDYSLVLHAFLLGFVFSMIFGHAPIILPALTGVQLRFAPMFYVHLALLHVTLAYRMYGNLAGDLAARQRGGLLNAITILLFLAVTAITVFRSNTGQQPARAEAN